MQLLHIRCSYQSTETAIITMYAGTVVSNDIPLDCNVHWSPNTSLLSIHKLNIVLFFCLIVTHFPYGVISLLHICLSPSNYPVLLSF